MLFIVLFFTPTPKMSECVFSRSTASMALGLKASFVVSVS